MNEVSVFKNQDFGEVRTTEIDGKPYFVANDIAKALGYVETAKAVRTHCKGVSEMDIPSNGGKQTMKVIPEGDVYRLIIKSKLPSAEKFESWVMDEVLPQIRQTGGYIPIKEEDDDMDIMSKALIIAHKTLEKKNQIISNMQPLAAIAEERIDKKGCVSLTDVTKTFKFKRGQISRWAKAQGYLHMTLTEVNNVGEQYFKVYSSDMIHNQIGITEDGIKLIEANKDEISAICVKYK